MRLFILIGINFLFMHLHASGNISKYINMKYSYVSKMAMIILTIFTIMEFYIYLKEDPENEDHDHHDDCHCGHDHSNENKGWRKSVMYLLLLFPVFTGIFLPVATMDSSIVDKKGFNFSVYDDSDPYSSHQFLQPDTSLYYGKDQYLTLMEKARDQLLHTNGLTLNDSNYLKDLETIYSYPGEFTGKQMTLTGFSYQNSEGLDPNQVFLFRFGIIHCVSDSGVFGILVDMPKGIHPQNDEWYTVTGELETIYYQPFKKTIPVLKVSSYTKIEQPEEPYVYRKY
ncbi:TIGR03943 family putative permease subunit [Niallia oryzisoli]|uniref:TIGR03943 family putative permease subunit n=1 Tax=Niallia oryzisoli TaxID=1737571 RepID=UPI003736D70F